MKMTCAWNTQHVKQTEPRPASEGARPPLQAAIQQQTLMAPELGEQPEESNANTARCP
jgi:hypothetical protein